jgi:hypothetical protein
MTAKEARELTEKKLAGPAIQPFLDAIYAKIQQAADAGRKSITHPWAGVRMPYPTMEQKDAIWSHLIGKDGYIVTHHKNPDPGDPRSSDYTEISWG